MAKHGKYERIEDNNKKKQSGSNSNKKNNTNNKNSKNQNGQKKSNNSQNKNKQQSHNKSQQQKQKKPEQQNTQTPKKVENIVDVAVEPIVQPVVQTNDAPSNEVISTAASRNPMNATKISIQSDMPALVNEEPSHSPIDANTGKIIYQDANALGFADKLKNQANEEKKEPEIPVQQSTVDNSQNQMRPHEKRKAAVDEAKKKEAQKAQKKIAQKPKVERQNNKPKAETKPVKKRDAGKSEAVLAYEANLRQVEKEGMIAGCIILLIMGLLFGGYYLLSQMFPQISVDALADRLIGWVLIGFVDMTTQPIDMESIPIFGAILQWFGELWHNMVF